MILNFKYAIFFISCFWNFCRSLFILAWNINFKNWKCFNEIIEKSAEDKISIKALMEVSPSYLIKGKNNNMSSKIRVVADACFR